MPRAWLALGLALASAALSPGCAAPREKVWLRVELPPELAGSETQLEVLPHIAEASRKLGRGIALLQLKRDAGLTRLRLPGACPLAVDVSSLPGAAPAQVTLQPLFDVGPSERVVGLGQAFELRAVPACPEARAAKARLEVAGGAALELLSISPDGLTLSATTAASVPARSSVAGIIPVSASERARLRSELELRVELPDGSTLKRRLGVSAVARASGLPNVGLTHPVLLSGQDWVLDRTPARSQAKLRAVGGLMELVTDVPGRYHLTEPGGRELSILGGRYDETPLDCGRAGCHGAIAASAAASPMTQALASDLGGCHSLDDAACATACHATGEPGTDDGGFGHVARELGLPALPLEHEDLPRALRRLGGVGCLACHGPGAVPGVGERWALLRSDVCAVCHDAAPRYGHVRALAASRMGHADHRPETRQRPECARCHTTWGALGRPAPGAGQEVESFGLACVTCHDVHPHPGSSAQDSNADANANPTHAGLLRYPPLPSTLVDPPPAYSGVSRVCVGCHAPSASELQPEASAAALLAGQGGLDPVSGAALSLTPPHAAAPKGCLSCHDAGPPGLVLGAGHAFRAREASCGKCHKASTSRDPAIAERAQRLLARLDTGAATDASGLPPHARQRAAARSPQHARALRNVLLVLEDPAADVHHPRYANLLLDAAERFALGAP